MAQLADGRKQYKVFQVGVMIGMPDCTSRYYALEKVRELGTVYESGRLHAQFAVENTMGIPVHLTMAVEIIDSKQAQ